MNYILIDSRFGKESMKTVLVKMEQPCELLIRKSLSGNWIIWKRDGTIERVDRITEILEEENVINWGNHILGNADYYFKLNVPTAVSRTSNKRLSRKFLGESGIRVPYTRFSNRISGYRDMNYPVIVRPSFHMGGRDFNLVENYQHLQSILWGLDSANFYVSEVFHKTHEYRVHVGHGRVLFISEKPLVAGEIRANHLVNQEDWRALHWKEFHPGICQESIRAVEALGLDYGAVDIMYNSTNNTWAICEVNTSPSVTSEYSSGKYAQYFDWVIRHDFPDHFPLEEGKSIFYTKMLRE